MLSRVSLRQTGWLIAGLAVLAVALLSRGQVGALPPLALDHYGCEVRQGAARAEGKTAGRGEGELRVLTSTNAMAPQLAEALCASPAVARDHGRVTVYWTPRGELGTEDLVSQHFDLIWRRERELRGLLNGLDNYYASLQRLPAYSVFWISRDDTPLLTSDYFSRKRIGLVKDTRSQSSYQLPVGQLQEAGIGLEGLQIHYFDDRRALYQAFMQAEVDLISGLGDFQGRPVAENRRLAIAEDVSTGQWFVSRRAEQQGLRCSLLEALSVMTPLYRSINAGYQPAPRQECQP